MGSLVQESDALPVTRRWDQTECQWSCILLGQDSLDTQKPLSVCRDDEPITRGKLSSAAGHWRTGMAGQSGKEEGMMRKGGVWSS